MRACNRFWRRFSCTRSCSLIFFFWKGGLQLIFPDSWRLIDKINFVQRKILLNSIMYYQHDRNFISDFHYDDCCKKLVKLHKAYGPDFIDDSMYGYAFYDFDGSTGYHLYSRLTEEDKQWLGLIVQQKLDIKEW